MDEQTIEKIKKWLKIESELKLLALEAKKKKTRKKGIAK